MSLALRKVAGLLQIHLFRNLLHLPFFLATFSNGNHYFVAFGLIWVAPRHMSAQLLMLREALVAVLALKFRVRTILSL